MVWQGSKAGRAMKSIKQVAICVLFLSLAASIAALAGRLGIAVCLLALSLTVSVFVLLLVERRRQEAHRRELRELTAMKNRMALNASSQEKSLGLLFRQIQKLSNELSADDSSLKTQNEKLTAISVRAVHLAKTEIVAALEAKTGSHS